MSARAPTIVPGDVVYTIRPCTLFSEITESYISSFHGGVVWPVNPDVRTQSISTGPFLVIAVDQDTVGLTILIIDNTYVGWTIVTTDLIDGD